MLVLLKKNDGTSWGKADTISAGMPGSMHNRMVIDNNNRVYVFWFQGNKTYYKYFENEIYSEIFCPYNDNDRYFFRKIKIDINNNIHCIGTFRLEGQSGYDNISTYYSYDYSNNLWKDKVLLSENNCWKGAGIDMSSTQLPHVTWHEPTTDSPLYNDATFYTFFNGITWAENEIVVEDPKYQTIAIDGNNRVHITNQEKIEFGVQLVHYQKNGGDWEGFIVDTAKNLVELKLGYRKDKLFLLYARYRIGQGGSIFFSRLDLTVNIIKNSIKYYYADELRQNYPNPFKYLTTFHFYLNKGGNTSLKILDLQGRLIKTLVKGHKAAGKYNIKWDGTGNNGQKLAKGIYLYRLQVNNRVKTRSLIIN